MSDPFDIFLQDVDIAPVEVIENRTQTEQKSETLTPPCIETKTELISETSTPSYQETKTTLFSETSTPSYQIPQTAPILEKITPPYQPTQTSLISETSTPSYQAAQLDILQTESSPYIPQPFQTSHKDAVLIEDLLGDFTTPVLSEGARSDFSSTNEVSKTSFFLLDLDIGEGERSTASENINDKKIEGSEDEEDEDRTLEASEVDEFALGETLLPRAGEVEKSSGYFFDDLLSENSSAFVTKTSSKDILKREVTNPPVDFILGEVDDDQNLLQAPVFKLADQQTFGLDFLSLPVKFGNQNISEASNEFESLLDLPIRIEEKEPEQASTETTTNIEAFKLDINEEGLDAFEINHKKAINSFEEEENLLGSLTVFDDSNLKVQFVEENLTENSKNTIEKVENDLIIQTLSIDEQSDQADEKQLTLTNNESALGNEFSEKLEKTISDNEKNAKDANEGDKLISDAGKEIDEHASEPIVKKLENTNLDNDKNVKDANEGEILIADTVNERHEHTSEPIIKRFLDMDITLKELEAKVRPVFEHCDTEKTGLISIDHLNQLCKEHGKDTESLLSRLDLDGTGQLNLQQFIKGVATLLGVKEEEVKENETDTKAENPPKLEEENVEEDTVDGCAVSSAAAGMNLTHPVTGAGHTSLPSNPSPPSPRFNSSPHSLTDSALGGEGEYSTSPDLRQSDFSDEREEILECFGERDHVDFDSDMTDGMGKSEGNPQGGGGGGGLVRRNSWLRTSLRRSSPKNENLVPPRRWGSFRTPRNRSTASFASALYQSGNPASFNSSGRSSNCDDGEMQDIHSDISIEDDVIDLNNKVHQLQEQVGILAEHQASNDDRYTRVKQENAALTARIHMLEEHIREIEVRGEERLAEEQRRNRELVARLEREKELELENFSIRNSSLEQETNRLKEENGLLRRDLDRAKEEKRSMEEQMQEIQRELMKERDARKMEEEERRAEREAWESEQIASNHHIQELSREIEDQRRLAMSSRQVDSGHHSVEEVEIMAELPARIADMEGQIRSLRDANRKLEENNEELQAQMLNKGLDEGRKLLSDSAANNSLAAEFEAMSENESPEYLIAEIEKMRKTLKEQQDVNRQLRSYIDNVLLNIMDKYPELLEIRPSK